MSKTKIENPFKKESQITFDYDLVIEDEITDDNGEVIPIYEIYGEDEDEDEYLLLFVDGLDIEDIDSIQPFLTKEERVHYDKD